MCIERFDQTTKMGNLMTVFTDPLGKERQSHIDEKVYGIARRGSEYSSTELPPAALNEPAVIPMNELSSNTPGATTSTSNYQLPNDTVATEETQQSLHYQEANRSRLQLQDAQNERPYNTKRDDTHVLNNRVDDDSRSSFRQNRTRDLEAENNSRNRRLVSSDRGRNDNHRGGHRPDQRDREYDRECDSREYDREYEREYSRNNRRNDYNKPPDSRDYREHYYRGSGDRDNRNRDRRDRHSLDNKTSSRSSRGSDRLVDSHRSSSNDSRRDDRRRGSRNYDDGRGDSYSRSSSSRPRTPEVGNSDSVPAETSEPMDVEDSTSSDAPTQERTITKSASSEALDLDSRIQMMLNRTQDLAGFGSSDRSSLPGPAPVNNASTTPVLDEEPTHLPAPSYPPPPLPTTDPVFPGMTTIMVHCFV